MPCLTAIGSSLSPDYALTFSTTQDESNETESGLWQPKPVDAEAVGLTSDLQEIIRTFAQHYHDSWAARKVGFKQIFQIKVD